VRYAIHKADIYLAVFLILLVLGIFTISMSFIKTNFGANGLNELGDAVNPLITLVAILFACFSWKTALDVKNTEEKNFLRTNVYEVVLAEVRDRKIDLSKRVGAPDCLKSAKTLRLAKSLAREWAQKEEPLWNKQAQKKWDGKAVYGNKTWQADVAFEVGDSLQQMGILAMTGTLPLAPTLMHVSVAIVNDWLLCSKWIEAYNSKRNLFCKELGGKVYYHRRHGECLALIAIAHMRWKKWNLNEVYPENEHLLENNALEKRLRLLSSIDRWGIPLDVCIEIKELTGMSI
jgi:hypothetical protein